MHIFQDLTNSENRIFYRGGIVGKRETTRSTSIRVAARKVQRSKGNQGMTNFVDFMIDTARGEKLVIGQSVDIFAHVRTGMRTNETGKREFYTTYMVDEVRPAPRILSAYYPEIDGNGGGQDDENVVVFAGPITHLYCPNNSVSIVTIGVKDGDSEYVNYCRAVAFRRQAKELRENMKVGDIVAMVGEINTENETKSGYREVSADVIVRDIAILEPAKASTKKQTKKEKAEEK